MDEIRADKFISSSTICNDSLGNLPILIKESRYPLGDKVIKYMEDKKIILLYNERKNEYSDIRFIVRKDKVYVNISNDTKIREEIDKDIFHIQIDIAYAYLIGALTKLKFLEFLSFDRDILADCTNVYTEFMRRSIIRQNHISSDTSRNKMDFILIFYIMCNTPRKIVTNILNYAQKMSNITEEDFKMLQIKYNNFNKVDMTLNEMWYILQKEYIFLREVDEDNLKYQVIFNYGAANIDLISDLSIIACIIVDFCIHNKATLNVTKNNYIKDSIKSTMYNNILTKLREKA
mgnify:CR=1 FL=1|nr:MAG TPA: hypothetical protein [Caudoviricetes sp.]